MKLDAKLYLSRLTNPFLNLCIENYLFKNLPADSRKFIIYSNDPCVVIGRNQNPWRECNIPLLNSLGIPLVRRRSGGGSVVHDSGNINFSSMAPRKEFVRDEATQMIVDALNEVPPRTQKIVQPKYTQQAGDSSSSPLDFSNAAFDDGAIPIWANGPQYKIKLNDRHDIVTDNEMEYKVSGSAFKIQRQKAYHHATMLLNSRLDVLTALLRRDPFLLGEVDGSGVESVKSPVTNIECDKDIFIDTALMAYRKNHGFDNEELVEIVDESQLPDEIKQEAKEMNTWNWAFAQTPKFTHTLNHPELDFTVKFTVQNGLIQSVDGLHDGEDLIGTRYISTEISSYIQDSGISQWLQDSIDGGSSESV